MTASQPTISRVEPAWIDTEPVRGGYPDPALLALSGLDRMRAPARRLMPAPPIHHLFGLRPVSVGPASVTFSIPTSPRLMSDEGFFYAGTAALVADAALAGAVQVTLPPGAIVATSDLSFNFLRPVTVASQRLVARARPIDVGKSLGLAEASIEDGLGHLIAHATTRCFISRWDPPPVVEEPAEVPEPNYPDADPYQRAVPMGGTRIGDYPSFEEIVAAKRRGELPLAPCLDLFGFSQPSVDGGSFTLTAWSSPWLTSPVGVVYGGVLALLADIVLSGSISASLSVRTVFSPLDLKVQFLRPVVPDGRQLRATGTVAYRGRRMAAARAEIVNEDDKPVVLATSSVVLFPDKTWAEVSVADEPTDEEVMPVPDVDG